MAIGENEYQEWVRRFDTLDDSELERARRYARALPKQPRIDVVMPVFDPPEAHLSEAIASVQRQVYDNWTLCIADDGSTRESVRDVLRAASRDDPRIRVHFLEANRGIAGATNAALSLGSGEFVALVDHDDVIAPHALLMVADRLNESPDANLVYSDYDFLDDRGLRHNPFFKPDYDHELLLGQNFITQLTVYRRAVLEQAGGMRAEYPGSEDYDLALRFVERVPESTILHIAHVLYHWRMVTTSSTHSRFLTAVRSAMKAVGDHCSRLGVDVTVAPTPRSLIWNRVRAVRPAASVRIVSCSGTPEDSRRALDECIANTDYPNIGSALVAADGTPGAVRNGALRESTEEFVVFLDSRLKPRGRDWLTEMIGAFLFDECAAVGARVIAPNGRVEQSGLLLGVRQGESLPVARAFHGVDESDPTYFGRAEIVHRVAAASGAMVVKRSAAEASGGFDEQIDHPLVCDVDLCLRLRQRGWTVVLCPHAAFDATVSPEPIPDSHPSAAALRKAWGKRLQIDPTYNPNLTATSTDFGLADPPRATFPWRAG